MSIIARAARADHFEASADAVGIPYKGMHRVASMASGGMASLPHNGAVITLLAVTGLTHRQSYIDIFMVTVIGPLVALTVVLILGSTLGSF